VGVKIKAIKNIVKINLKKNRNQKTGKRDNMERGQNEKESL
jgi:hypothetical protein